MFIRYNKFKTELITYWYYKYNIKRFVNSYYVDIIYNINDDKLLIKYHKRCYNNFTYYEEGNAKKLIFYYDGNMYNLKICSNCVFELCHFICMPQLNELKILEYKHSIDYNMILSISRH